MAVVYLALYKGRAKNRLERWQDNIIRFLSKGKYSHCELAIKTKCHKPDEIKEGVILPVLKQVACYECYSSSPRDGGVRHKVIDMESGNWDLIEFPDVSEAQIVEYFEKTKGAKYDWWGVIGIVLGIKQKRSKYFCSEWCFNAIKGGDDGWRFSPNQLSAMFKVGS